MKKIPVLILASFLFLGILTSCAQKGEGPDLQDLANIKSNELTEAQLTSFKSQMSALDDKAYDDLIADLVNTASDYKGLQETLKVLDVELLEAKVQYHEEQAQNPNADMTLYASKRERDSYYRLYARYKLESMEYNPGPADVVTIYFDTSKADYYLYNCESKYTSLRSGQYATSGTLAFNFYDDIASINYSYAVAYVTPKSDMRGQWLDYGAEWTHTFTGPETQTWSIKCINTVKL